MTNNKKHSQFNVKSFCVEQLQRSDREITAMIDAARYKLGVLKQYNNAVKNDIDKARIDIQAQESMRKTYNALNK